MKPMAPGLFSIILIFLQQAIFIFIYFAVFTFNLYHKNIKNIILSSLSNITLINDREWIDNPFIALVARFLFVCVSMRDTPTGLIPWFSKLREILTLLCCITLSSSRENQRIAQEVALHLPPKSLSPSSN